MAAQGKAAVPGRFANLPGIAAIAVMAALMGVHVVRPDLRVAVAGSVSSPVPVPAGGTAPVPAGGTPPAPASGSPSIPTAPSGTPLRVLTWNLRDCAATLPGTGERLSLHDAIAGTIAGIAPDLALLQEIQQDDEKGGDIALLQVALAKAGWSMPYQVSVETGGQDDLALFSRHPIRESGAVLQPGGTDPWPRPGLRALVLLGPAELEVYNFHFKAMSDAKSEAARAAQAKAAAALLRNSLAERGGAAADGGVGGRRYFALLGGDFNTINPGDRQGEASTLRSLTLRDDQDASNDFVALNETLLPGVPTYADERWRSVTDHLIVSGDLAGASGGPPAAAVRIAGLPPPERGAVPVSDHYPVVADLRLP